MGEIVSLALHKYDKEEKAAKHAEELDRALGCPVCYGGTGEAHGEWNVIKFVGTDKWILVCADCDTTYDLAVPVPADSLIKPVG